MKDSLSLGKICSKRMFLQLGEKCSNHKKNWSVFADVLISLNECSQISFRIFKKCKELPNRNHPALLTGLNSFSVWYLIATLRDTFGKCVKDVLTIRKQYCFVYVSLIQIHFPKFPSKSFPQTSAKFRESLAEVLQN